MRSRRSASGARRSRRSPPCRRWSCVRARRRMKWVRSRRSMAVSSFRRPSRLRNLFYNVPARRKFLEKSTTSTGQIKSEFQRVALCNPQVGFELLMNDQPLYRLPAASLASRIVDVVGRHIKQNLLEVDADTSIVRVTGFVGRPAAAKKSNSSEQYLFVNGRYFRSPYFFKAILKAYEKLIPDALRGSTSMSIPRRPKSSSLTKRPCGRSSTLPCGKLSPRRERCRSWISIRRTASRFRC
mgnify:CR=1 FL=1